MFTDVVVGSSCIGVVMWMCQRRCKKKDFERAEVMCDFSQIGCT